VKFKPTETTETKNGAAPLRNRKLLVEAASETGLRKSEIVILANRLPVHRTRREGEWTWEFSPGGLVSAMTPVLRERESIWIGWAGGAGASPEPFVHEGIQNVPVSISREEMSAYYDGFSNRTLWPLYHDAIQQPEFERSWWEPFVDVNRRFARAAAQHVSRNGTVWVHDYHLQLVPAMLRQMRPDLRIGFFLHIPFPPQELFARLPWRSEILEGLLGADVVGFQTRAATLNFCRLCRRYVNAGGRGADLQHNRRLIRARTFPISIDFAHFEKLARSPAVQQRAAHHRARLGSERRLILGVDRLDYTKGIEQRLRVYQELLRSGGAKASDSVFVQVGVPSRERVGAYREVRSRIEALIGQINGNFGELGLTPVHYLHRRLPLDELAALYAAADVMFVTPLRDGMNLVAKEYVATRVDNTGVLVLSEFTGAAGELHSAVLVNPHDDLALQAGLDRALNMRRPEQAQRMRTMRRAVRSHDVYAWARAFFEALSV